MSSSPNSAAGGSRTHRLVNTFQRNLRDQAAAEAKRADTSTVDAVHVAAAIAASCKDPSLQELRTRARTRGATSGEAAMITPEADALLARSLDEASSREVLAEYLQGVPIEPGASSRPPQDPPANTTSAQSPASPDEATVADILKELDALVGLADVKTQVQRFLAVHQANLTRQQQGLPKVPHSLHLVFTGDPGTGKTTVARIVGRLYRAAGLLPSGHLVETDRSGLVAGFVGQTAIKVQEVLQRADGGVLFIDEAYSLASEAREDFGQEAVAALVKGMEDRRETMAVIAAGYEEQMKGFISMNPGLRSRFQTFVAFPNYSPEEMSEIFVRMGQQHEIGVSQVLPIVRTVFEKTNTGGDAGNGRFVRSLFEQMYANLAVRAAADGQVEAHEITEFEPEDVPDLPAEPQKPRIGFV